MQKAITKQFYFMKSLTSRVSTLLTGLMLIVCFVPQSSAQQGGLTLSLSRSVDLRDGPGSYYDLVLRLNKGATVTRQNQEDGWIQVAVDDYQGWMPDHPAYYSSGDTKAERGSASSEESMTSRMGAMFDQLSGDSTSSDSAYVLPAQVAAAVKGFARKYKTSRSVDTNVDFTRSFEDRINPRDYRRFRRSRISLGDWYRAKERFILSNDTIPEFTPNIEQMGWAIASTIAAQEGLVQNYEVQEYLNYVGLLVTESSHRYEIPIQVHILDTDDVVGYSTPNGIIFVSKGALKLIETEAELAFFIGHELAHVVLQHGVQETRDRRTKIDADKAFRELEEDMNYEERQDDEYVQISQELTAWTDQVYEYIISDKLEAYEHQADYWGMIYAWRAGYNPMAATNLLRRFKQDVGDFETQIGELKWQGTSLSERMIRCTNHIEQMHEQPDLNDDFRDEYQKMKRMLE